jgi:hypothetical protein
VLIVGCERFPTSVGLSSPAKQWIMGSPVPPTTSSVERQFSFFFASLLGGVGQLVEKHLSIVKAAS